MLAALALALLAGRTGASGELDPTFSDGGIVTTAFHHAENEVLSVALQPDGAIVVAGFSSGGNNETALARYTAEGHLDPSFGDGGVVLRPGAWGALAVTVQSDGKILVAVESGFGEEDFTLLRFEADGQPDSGFGVGGVVTTGFAPDSNDQANALAIQPDGRILAAGYTGADLDPADFAVARYLADGTLDASFGSGGIVVTDFGASSADARSIALQSDGKIVVAGRAGGAGSTGSDFAIVRYLADGTPDVTFGTGGIVLTDFAGSLDYGRAVAVQPDGGIVVAGFARSASDDFDFALARYLTDGSLDPAFGSAGLVTTDLGGASGDFGHGLALQVDGRIVVTGDSGDDFGVARYLTDGTPDPAFAGGSVVVDFGRGFARAGAVDGAGGILAVGSVEHDFAIARFLSDGSLDPSFGSAGLVTTDFGLGRSKLNAITVQPDGKLVAVGRTGTAVSYAMAVARYLPTGQLDAAFGADGRALASFPAANSSVAAVDVAPDGRIVVGGSAGILVQQDWALARFLPDGTLDATFGSGGRVITDFGGASDSVVGLAVQPDGKIVAVGGNGDFRAARYNVDGSLDGTFGSGGVATVEFPVGNSRAHTMALQPDGKIVIAGTAGDFPADIALARLEPDGDLDPTFGDGGLVVFDTPQTSAPVASDLALQPDGKILVALTNFHNDFAATRFNADGTVDWDFGVVGGITTTDLSAGNVDDSWSVALLPDDTFVLGGQADHDIAVAHYLPDGELDTDFGDGGFTITDLGSVFHRAYAVYQPLGRIVMAGRIGSDFVLAAYVAPVVLLADGFESGDTAAWSATFP